MIDSAQINFMGRPLPASIEKQVSGLVIDISDPEIQIWIKEILAEIKSRFPKDGQ